MKAKAFLVVLQDILLFGVILIVFAFFHHVQPHPYEPIQSIVPAAPAPQATSNAHVSGDPAGATEPLAIGDFSDTFPDSDTGVGVAYSYQKDDLRIAVSRVQENGVTYFAADIWVKNIELLTSAFAGGQFSSGVTQTVRRMAQDNGSILAVSGDFCGAHKMGTVIRNGILYRKDNGEQDVCVLYYDGTMAVFTADAFCLDAAIANGAWQVWSFGPNLLENGEEVSQFHSSIAKENPRCAIGYFEPGHYCLVVVDGRQDGYSVGMTLVQLSSLMKQLGCTQAYNLDGGATAVMVFDGSVISSPSGGGRASSDIICFAKEGD